jgi:hypothetical protein
MKKRGFQIIAVHNVQVSLMDHVGSKGEYPHGQQMILIVAIKELIQFAHSGRIIDRVEGDTTNIRCTILAETG